MKTTAFQNRIDYLTSLISEIVSELTGIEVDHVDDRATFTEMGFDSELGRKVSEHFQEKYQIDIHSDQLDDSILSPRHLAHYLDERLPIDSMNPPAQTEDINGPNFEIDKYRSQLLNSSITAPKLPSGVETIIAQQLMVMQQQLAVLAASGFDPNIAAERLKYSTMLSPQHMRNYRDNDQKNISDNDVDENISIIETQEQRLLSLSEDQKDYVRALVNRIESGSENSGKFYKSAPQLAGRHQTLLLGEQPLHAPVIAREEGTRVFDIDGREYIDLDMDRGLSLLGHPIDSDKLSEGMSEDLNQETETAEAAKLLCELSGFDSALFFADRPSAVNVTLRACQLASSKRKIAYFPSSLEAKQNSAALPVNEYETFSFGSRESIDSLRARGDIWAAALIESVQWGKSELHPRAFMQELRALCNEFGIRLIYDETLTGFRSHIGSDQKYYDAPGDLAVYAGMSGKNYMLAAVAGAQDIMDTIEFGQTATLPQPSALSIKAFRRILSEIRKRGSSLQDDLASHGATLSIELNRHFGDAAYPVRIEHFGSIFSIDFKEFENAKILMPYVLRDLGVLISSTDLFFLSSEHSEEDISYISWAIKTAADSLRSAGILPGEATFIPEKPFSLSTRIFIPSADPVETIAAHQTIESEKVKLELSKQIEEISTDETNSSDTKKDVREIELEPTQEPEELETPTQLSSSSLFILSEGIIDEIPIATPESLETLDAPKETIIADTETESVVTEQEITIGSEQTIEIVSDTSVSQEADQSRDKDNIQPEEERAQEEQEIVFSYSPISPYQQVALDIATANDERGQTLSESLSLHCRGFFDLDAFQKSLEYLAHVSRKIRSSFDLTENRIKIASHVELRAEFIDLSERASTSLEADLSDTIRKSHPAKFDLSIAPLCSVRVIRVDEFYHVAQIDAHSGIFSPADIKEMAKDLGRIYTNIANNAAFDDHFFASLSCLAPENTPSGEQIEIDNSYWSDALQKTNPSTIRSVVAPTEKQSYACSTIEALTPGSLLADIRDVSEIHSGSVASTSLAVWASLLSRITGQRDIGILLSADELQSDVPILLHAAETSPFLSLCESAFDQIENSLAHPVTPPRDKTDHFALGFNTSHSRFDIDFGTLNVEGTVNPKQSISSDFEIRVCESSSGLIIAASYRTDLFDPETARDWIKAYQRSLESASRNPYVLLQDIEASTAEDKAVLIDTGQTDEDQKAAAITIGQAFETQAKLTPNAIAATINDHKISYGQLSAYSNQLANYLQAKGVGCNKLVGLLVDRSLEMIIAALAILKSGGGYLPLDPENTAATNDIILSGADVTEVLTQHKYTSRIPEQDKSAFFLDTDWELISSYSPSFDQPECGPTSAAFVSFEKDNDGAMHGVVTSHTAVVRMAMSSTKIGADLKSIVLQAAPLTSHISAYEIWSTLLMGARLSLCPANAIALSEILESAAKHRVNQLFISKSDLKELVLNESIKKLSHARKLIVLGKHLTSRFAARVFDALPDAKIAIAFSCPEAGGIISASIIDKESLQDGVVFASRPEPTKQIFVIDSIGDPVPGLIPGEIAIGGNSLALGYLNEPGRTAQRFSANYLAESPDYLERLFLSRIPARKTSENALEFLLSTAEFDDMPETPTPPEMTETPQDESSSQSSEPLKIESFLTVLQQKGSRPPLYFAPDLDDLRDTSLYLSKKIDENRPFIETRAVDWKQEDAKGIDIEKIARIISQQIVRSNPEGPYYICGAATGGCVAFAIAGNLVQLGKRVALLALIDSYAPHPHKNEISLSGSLSPLQRLFARLFKIPGAKQKKSNGPKNAAIGSPGAIAVSKYSPSRYPGRITLFCSDEKAENADPLLGWTELADDIMVCEIHSSKGSLLSEKNIDLLANKLRQQIT